MSLHRALLLIPLVCTILPASANVPGMPLLTQDSLAAQRIAAERGDPEAMVALGWRYYDGQGVTADGASAVRWFQAAADVGNAAGMYGLALCHRFGIGVATDAAAADALMRRAAELGFGAAQDDVGEGAAMRFDDLAADPARTS